MHWLKGSLAILASVTAASCDQSGLREPSARPPLPESTAAPIGDLQTYAGRSYADFVAAHEDRFGASGLGIEPADAARLERVVGAAQGALLDGGGAQALVFRGCAETGCVDGVGVVAVDAATGETFIGVRDASGQEVLAPNDRLEALLRLNTPTRDWSDTRAIEPAPPAPQIEPARP